MKYKKPLIYGSIFLLGYVIWYYYKKSQTPTIVAGPPSVVTGSSQESQQYPTQAQQLAAQQASDLANLAAQTATSNANLAANTANQVAYTNLVSSVDSATIANPLKISVSTLLGGGSSTIPLQLPTPIPTGPA